jgi:hypothetical protein
VKIDHCTLCGSGIRKGQLRVDRLENHTHEQCAREIDEMGTGVMGDASRGTRAVKLEGQMRAYVHLVGKQNREYPRGLPRPLECVGMAREVRH